jgi:hypothetical protein
MPRREPTVRIIRNVAVLVTGALALGAALVIYRTGHSEATSITDKNTLVIGVKSDQPGLG